MAITSLFVKILYSLSIYSCRLLVEFVGWWGSGRLWWRSRTSLHIVIGVLLQMLWVLLFQEGTANNKYHHDECSPTDQPTFNQHHQQFINRHPTAYGSTTVHGSTTAKPWRLFCEPNDSTTTCIRYERQP